MGPFLPMCVNNVKIPKYYIYKYIKIMICENNDFCESKTRYLMNTKYWMMKWIDFQKYSKETLKYMK